MQQNPMKLNVIQWNTVEPPNKGDYGADNCVPCREFIPISEALKCFSMGLKQVLCREVIPILEGPLSEVPL